GPTASHILLGPVRLDGVEPISDAAAIIVDTNTLGRPAQRMGDVNGDGITDLVFWLANDTDSRFSLSILFGHAGGNLPRVLTGADVDRRLIVDLPLLYVDVPYVDVPTLSDAEMLVLDWDGDGFDDVALLGNSGVSIAGQIFSGKTLTEAPPVSVASEVLLTILPDSTVLERVLVDIFDTAPDGGHWTDVLGASKPSGTFVAAVAGDVNGDGLDDLLLGDPQFVHIERNFLGTAALNADLGRAYLLLGRADPPLFGVVSLAKADSILQDWELGDSLAALGDVNLDGYDDFAIGRNREDNLTAPGGLLIFHGSEDPSGFNGVRLTSELLADQTVRRQAPGQLGSGLAMVGTLEATAGDFNGDGRVDLAIGEPLRIVENTTGDVLATDARGRLYVFFSVADQGDSLVLTDADVVLQGESASDRLGTLPSAPGLDLNGDRIHDIVTAASRAVTLLDDRDPLTGKVYAIYGARTPGELPEVFNVLSNRSITGSGDFLVGPGQPEVFPFAFASAGAGAEELWYRFTTLGDGSPGKHILVAPEARETQTTLIEGRFGLVTRVLDGFTVTPAGDDVLLSGKEGAFGVMEFDLGAYLDRLDPADRLDNADPLEAVRLMLASVVPAGGGSLRVDVLASEGDGYVTAVDATAEATFTTEVELVTLGTSLLDVDLTEAVRKALESGKTRLTVRFRFLEGGDDELLEIDNSAAAQTGLMVTTAREEGVLADLHDAQGALLQSNRSLLDMQLLSAGTYFLRVYNPFAAAPTAFTILVTPPAPGDSHPISDRDTIRAGDGNDVVAGNADIDALFGEGGDDQFHAEKIEVRDAEPGELPIIDPRASDDIRTWMSGPLDARVLIPDPSLRLALAEALGIPITTSWRGTPIESRSLFLSDLGALKELDAGHFGITDISGLESAVNLRKLILSGNEISDLSPIQPVSAGQSGAMYLEYLNADGNQIFDLSPLELLSELERLSLDGNPITDLRPLAGLTQLDFLSIDGPQSALPRLPRDFLYTGTRAPHQLTQPPSWSGTFGHSIAVIGNRILVGSPTTQVGGVPYAGAVYVFDATTGRHLSTINNPDPEVYHRFGHSLAPFGENILVGAPRSEVDGFSGAGVVFVLDVSTGLQLFDPIPNPNAMSDSSGTFGLSVNVFGQNILVGAPNAPTEGGAVYVFDGANGRHLQTIDNPNSSTSDRFGSSLEVLGHHILVGAPGYDSPLESDVGIVYLFEGLTGEPFLTINNLAPDVEPPLAAALGDSFGQTLAVSGNQIWVGAPGDFSDPSAERAVYSFTLTPEGIDTPLRLTVPTEDVWFGSAIASVGANVLIGAPPLPTSDEGAAYLFNPAGVLLATLSPSPGNGESFGHSVAAVGTAPLVGATLFNFMGIEVSAGSVYLYDAMGPHDLWALKDLTELKWLSVSGNRIEDITPLDGLGHLEHLYLNNNRIRSIETLADMESTGGGPALLLVDQLQTLRLEDNPLDNDAHELFVPQFESAWETREVDFSYGRNPHAPVVEPIGPQSIASEETLTIDLLPPLAVGGGLTFDGGDDVMRLPTEVLHNLTSVTTEFWLNTSKRGSQAILSGASSDVGRSGADNEYLIYLHNSSTLRLYSKGKVSQWDISAISLEAGGWHHFAVVSDATSAMASLYVDGVWQGFRLFDSTPLDIDSLVVGQEQDSVTGPFDPEQALEGTLKDLVVWSVARAAQQIRSDRLRVRSDGAGGFSMDEPGLVAYWRLDDAAGTASDSSGNGRHGTLGIGVTAPVWTPQPEALGRIVAALDEDGDEIFFTVESDNALVTVDVEGGQLVATSGTDLGTATITVTAHDGPSGPGDWRGRTDRHTFDINVGLGAIYGTIWHELDRSGTRDPDEPLLEGWTVFIDLALAAEPLPKGWTVFIGPALADEPLGQTETDADGNYALTDLPEGNYAVTVDVPAAWYTAHPGAYRSMFADSFADSTPVGWVIDSDYPTGGLGLGDGLGGGLGDGLRINEFLAVNVSNLRDEDLNFSDWIELHNPTPTAINLAGWSLTDDASQLTKWRLPQGAMLGPDEFLIVFASGENRTDPTGPLHTNFVLRSGGGFLALIEPDGQTVATVFGAGSVGYPEQFPDVSYGFSAGDLSGSTLGAPTPGFANEPKWHLSRGRRSQLGGGLGSSLYFGWGETENTFGNYDAGRTAGTITSPPIDLTDASEAQLHFNYFLETDGSTDVAEVLVSSDGAPYLTVLANRGGGLSDSTADWTPATVDLMPFLGGTIQVRFAFDSIDAQNNTYEGWSIDDVTVAADKGAPFTQVITLGDGNLLATNVDFGMLRVVSIEATSAAWNAKGNNTFAEGPFEEGRRVDVNLHLHDPDPSNGSNFSYLWDVFFGGVIVAE
ncbi:MAG: leucine-rich repeat domain-containing protein, partial [Thermoguttaceae bacterium]